MKTLPQSTKTKGEPYQQRKMNKPNVTLICSAVFAFCGKIFTANQQLEKYVLRKLRLGVNAASVSENTALLFQRNSSPDGGFELPGEELSNSRLKFLSRQARTCARTHVLNSHKQTAEADKAALHCLRFRLQAAPLCWLFLRGQTLRKKEKEAAHNPWDSFQALSVHLCTL